MTVLMFCSLREPVRLTLIGDAADTTFKSRLSIPDLRVGKVARTRMLAIQMYATVVAYRQGPTDSLYVNFNSG